MHLAYSDHLQAAGGTAPYTWTPVGTLPHGLHLSTSGELAGKPTVAGTFTIKVKVHDSSSPTQETATKSLKFVVKR
jgi:hypothetical protein